MAQIKEIKSRIKTVKNIGQITKAMKMVATARLKRAQERILGARPYAIRMADVEVAVIQMVRELRSALLPLDPGGARSP